MIIDRTGAQTMLYLTCTTMTSVDLAHYGISRAKDWVSVNCGTIPICLHIVCAELWGNRSIDISKSYDFFPDPIYIHIVCVELWENRLI